LAQQPHDVHLIFNSDGTGASLLGRQPSRDTPIEGVLSIEAVADFADGRVTAAGVWQ
jgi:hypothetical protein